MTAACHDWLLIVCGRRSRTYRCITCGQLWVTVWPLPVEESINV
jgi:hypothetical protein